MRLITNLGALGAERLLDTFGFAHLMLLLTRSARISASMHETGMDCIATALTVGTTDGILATSLLATSRAFRHALGLVGASRSLFPACITL